MIQPLIIISWLLGRSSAQRKMWMKTSLCF
uniref:Uncharacterized protein n=1 Tax=Anguilla anguilla TaxID=7936 RepID=A0A0E9PC39_ANGAN